MQKLCNRGRSDFLESFQGIHKVQATSTFGFLQINIYFKGRETWIIRPVTIKRHPNRFNKTLPDAKGLPLLLVPLCNPLTLQPCQFSSLKNYAARNSRIFHPKTRQQQYLPNANFTSIDSGQTMFCRDSGKLLVKVLAILSLIWKYSLN